MHVCVCGGGWIAIKVEERHFFILFLSNFGMVKK